jgi:hypothetical protein
MADVTGMHLTRTAIPQRPDVSNFSSKLSTSVDVAISNVDRALYEMQSREVAPRSQAPVLDHCPSPLITCIMLLRPSPDILDS